MEQAEYKKFRNEKIVEMYRQGKLFSIVKKTFAIDRELVVSIVKDFLLAQENISEEYAIRKLRIWESEDTSSKIPDEQLMMNVEKILI